MCSIEAHEKNKKSFNDHKPVHYEKIIGGARSLLSNST